MGNRICIHGHFYQPPRESPTSGFIRIRKVRLRFATGIFELRPRLSTQLRTSLKGSGEVEREVIRTSTSVQLRADLVVLDAPLLRMW